MGSHDHLAALLENTLNIHDVHQPTILMGAMIADVLPNIGGIKGSLHSSWKGFGSFQISHLRRNLFCIKMNQDGAKRLLESGPWHVENHHFNVVPWPPNCTINDVPHFMAPYWVHISGLTLEKMNDSNARLIGSAIGEVIQLEDILPEDAFLRGYLRIRINIDSRRPFPAGFWLPISNNTSSRVEYSYEGLGTFCWRCALLGHNMDNCHSRIIIPPADSVWYGPWLSCKPPRSPPLFNDKPARVHRKKPSVHRVTGEERHTPYPTSNNAPRHYQRAKVNIPSASIEVQHSPPSPRNEGGSFDVCDTTGNTVGGVFSPNAFPSPNWYKLAVTTATTHVQWAKKNFRPMTKAHSGNLGGGYTLLENSLSPQHHSNLRPIVPNNTIISSPKPYAITDKHTSPPPQFSCTNKSTQLTVPNKSLLLTSSTTHLINRISTFTQVSNPPPPKFKRNPPKAYTPRKPYSPLTFDKTNPVPPKTAQINQSPPKTFFSYQRKFKRLASEVDLDYDVTNHKSRVVIDDTVDSVGTNLKGIPCGVVCDLVPGPLRRRCRSVGHHGRFGHCTKGGRAGNPTQLPGTFTVGTSIDSLFGPETLIPTSSTAVLVEITSDDISKSLDENHILEGHSPLRGSGGWPTATRSQ